MVESASGGANPPESQIYPPPKEIACGVPLSTMQDYFSGFHGRRNNVYLDSRILRVNLFSIEIGGLQDAIRKNTGRFTKEDRLARLVSRIFCIAQGINNVSVAKAMIEKYPMRGCSYCGQSPCVCEERRPEPALEEWNPQSKQMVWSLRDWQTHLRLLYGEKNKNRGVENTLNRLLKETAEMLSLEYCIRESNPSMDEVEHAYSLELADSLAWTIAMANLLDIDLEKVTVDEYGRGCFQCGQSPCACRRHDFNQEIT